MEGKKQYQFWKTMMTWTSREMNCSRECQNSAKESLGYYKRKQNTLRFDEEHSKLLAQREQTKL
jgi:hypothetical protein